MPEFEEAKPVNSKTDYELESDNYPKKSEPADPVRSSPTSFSQPARPRRPRRSRYHRAYKKPQSGPIKRPPQTSASESPPAKEDSPKPERRHPPRGGHRDSKHYPRSKPKNTKKSPTSRGWIASIVAGVKNLLGIQEPEPEKPKKKYYSNRRRRKNYRPNQPGEISRTVLVSKGMARGKPWMTIKTPNAEDVADAEVVDDIHKKILLAASHNPKLSRRKGRGTILPAPDNFSPQLLPWT